MLVGTAASQMTCVARWTPHNESWFSLHSRKLTGENLSKFSCNVAVHNLRRGSQGFCFLHYVSSRRYPTCHQSNIFAMSFSLEDSSIKNEIASGDSSEKVLPQRFSSNKLMSLLSDSERAKLIKKLSEANQHNRFLKRQLQMKDDDLLNFKSELALMELEVQNLVMLAEEIAKTGIQPGSRKINGKYIQSHLISRLQAVHKKLEEQINDVEVVQSKEVRLLWHGMAESVQVMGSFDGWSRGESLSPEYNGSYTQFSTTLMLRPGRYEIKFVVDEEWKISPELPTIGEGMLVNNLLVVE